MAAIAAAQAPADDVVVRIVGEADTPLPGAIAWTLPSVTWSRRYWNLGEHAPWMCNPHEFLRRVGKKMVADEAGMLRLARGTTLAVEHQDLAAFASIADDARSPITLGLDGQRWTIEVRDEGGNPVVGVPIVCVASGRHFFYGLPLGLTDAAGRLVVRAPHSVDVARFWRPGPASEFVQFQVDGMYLRDHAGMVRWLDPAPPTVKLTLPPATKVEVGVPEWNGPLADFVTMTRAGKEFGWQEVPCWIVGGKHYALVGVHIDGGTWVRAEIEEATIGQSVEVPRVAAGRTFPIELSLEEGDIVVRARVHDGDGRALELAYLEITPRSDALRTSCAYADRAGRFALVLRPELPAGTVIGVRVGASPDHLLVGAETSFVLPELKAGDRRDIGILELVKK